MEPSFLIALKALENMVGFELDISCGIRCPVKNKAVGGAKRSRHLPLWGQQSRPVDAVDIRIPDSAARFRLVECAMLLKGFGGIGIYNAHVHLDGRHERRVMWLG